MQLKSHLEDYLKKLSEKIFSELNKEESLSIELHSEESEFLRFSRSKIRQNTSVNQHELLLKLFSNHRISEKIFNLTLNLQQDLGTARSLLAKARHEILILEPHPRYLELTGKDSSSFVKRIKRPEDSEIAELVNQHFSDLDLVGFWCSGPIRKASLNSNGQFHFYEVDSFFWDFSIYDKFQGRDLAAKGFYSSQEWSTEKFLDSIQRTKTKLQLLKQPVKNLSPGRYPCYLEPFAVDELLQTVNRGSFSWRGYKQGYAPLRKLYDNELSFSEKLTFTENLDLGLSPQFNDLGELAPVQTTLIENGKPKNLLISTATAREYGQSSNIKSNFASASESCRSLEVKPGQLKQEDILKKLDTGLYLSNLHYVNWSDVQSARLTGMTRFACYWVENGEIQAPIQDLRFDDSLYSLWGSQLVDLTDYQEIFNNILTYQKRQLGGVKAPGMLIKSMNFTL